MLSEPSLESPPHLRNTTTTQLWEEWMHNRGVDSRNALFLHYSAWLRKISAHLYHQYPAPLAEPQDYLHHAALGLLEAIDRFDPTRAVPFEAYAQHRIKGAVLNHLSAYARIQKTHHDDEWLLLNNEFNTSDEADPLGQIVDATIGLALGKLIELGIVDDMANHAPNPLELYQTNQSMRILLQLVDRLSLKERLVIKGHYLHQLKLNELAQMLDISSPRVSQLHWQALRRLRVLYEESGA